MIHQQWHPLALELSPVPIHLRVFDRLAASTRVAAPCTAADIVVADTITCVHCLQSPHLQCSLSCHHLHLIPLSRWASTARFPMCARQEPPCQTSKPSPSRLSNWPLHRCPGSSLCRMVLLSPEQQPQCPPPQPHNLPSPPDTLPPSLASFQCTGPVPSTTSTTTTNPSWIYQPLATTSQQVLGIQPPFPPSQITVAALPPRNSPQ